MDIMTLRSTDESRRTCGDDRTRAEARKWEIDAIFAAKERDRLSRFGLARVNPNTESESTNAD